MQSRRSATTTKVFVGSLPPEVTTDDLRKLFEPYGAIAECDIANRCGFLHLEDRDLAMKAIEELNNTTFMGGKITVEKGRVKPPNRGRGRDGGPMRGGRDRGGPYVRDGGFRGPRNGGYRDQWSGGDRFNRYDDRGGMGPRGGYDGGYDRRPNYNERRGGGGGYMGDHRPYNNGYDDRRGGGYSDGAPPYQDNRAGGPAGYGNRDGPMGGGGYDRNGPSAGNEMYSRRGDPSGPKPLMPSNTGSYGTDGTNYGAPQGGYTGAPATGYTATTGGYGDTRNQTNTGYDNTQRMGSAPGYDNQGYNRQGSYTNNTTGGYGSAAPTGPPATNYSGSGYGAPAQTGAPTYGSTGTDYNTSNTGYNANVSGGYGDSYGNNTQRGSYDTSYPPLGSWRGGANAW